MKKKSGIGIIGLGTMGQNLALNIARTGRQVSVWNRTVCGSEEGIVQQFIKKRAAGKNIIGCETLGQLTETLESPRILLMMVPAGKPVDELIGKLTPLLSRGDILIDGGNSRFEDTTRRVNETRDQGIHFVGAGISGGEEGALKGASILPGGAKEAWPVIKPILQDIAAKAYDGIPCCEWVGPEGSGHFVKTIHNGIEYGDMQLIAEAYSLLKHLLRMNPEEMSHVFMQWNEGKLRSYLTEITSRILAYKDVAGDYLLDRILDVAGQKGTGQWSVSHALELGIPSEVSGSAVFERFLSTAYTLRERASRIYPRSCPINFCEKGNLVQDIEETLYASRLVSYAQEFHLLQRASEQYGWDLNLGAIARSWREGCIIRSACLDEIARTYGQRQAVGHLLLVPSFADKIRKALPCWKKTIAAATMEEVSVPASAAALNYFYSLTTKQLPTNLIQAQRDYFGAHTFERVDEVRGMFFHENWNRHENQSKP